MLGRSSGVQNVRGERSFEAVKVFFDPSYINVMSNTSEHTGHPKKHLPETYLRLSGQGLKLAGQGKGLVQLAGVAHKLAKSHHGKLGAAIIHAIGHVRNSKAKDKRKAFQNKLVTILGKRHYPQYAKLDIHKIINNHKHKLIGFKDVFGKGHTAHAKPFIDLISSGGNIFSAIGKAAKGAYSGLKHARDAAYHKLKQFANGKTKFKPSQLANYLAGAVGIAGTASAFIPGLDLISVPAAAAASLGLKSVGTVLKTSGRGKKGGGAKLPARIIKYVKSHPKEAKRVLALFKRKQKSGGGKKINIALGTAGAIMLFGFLKDNAGNIGNIGRAIGAAVTGSGLTVAGAGTYGISGAGLPRKAGKKGGCRCINRGKGLTVAGSGKKGGCRCISKKGKGLTVAGSGISQKIKEYMRKHPGIVKRMAARVKGSGKAFSGSGAAGRLTAALGIAGTSAAAGAYGMYQYLMSNPSVAAKIAAKGVGGIVGSYLKGGSLQAGMGKTEQFSAVQNSSDLPYGVTRLVSGKVKKDRYSVYHGYYNMTGSGLTKDAFALKGTKVVSKRRQALGRKNLNFRRKS